MHRHIAALTVALALTSCTTVPHETQYASSAFSFSQCELPSLMDINNGKFRVAATGGVYRLTNVHPSFDRSFVLLQDESRHLHVIKTKGGESVFEGYLDGIPRYAACVDIDGDGDADVLMEMAAYGNHGNGTESFQLLLNDHDHLRRIERSIHFDYYCGQESKAGLLTWYSARTFCAVFVGEEADVTGSGTETGPIMVGNIRKVREVWSYKNGQMWAISRSSAPLDRQAVEHLTFR